VSPTSQDVTPQPDPQDNGKGSSDRRLGFLWFIATSRGRRVALAVLLIMLVAIGGAVVHGDGYVDGLGTTLACWFAIVVMLVLIAVVAVLDILVIRLRFAAAQRDLVRKTIADTREPNDRIETDHGPDPPSEDHIRGK